MYHIYLCSKSLCMLAACLVFILYWEELVIPVKFQHTLARDVARVLFQDALVIYLCVYTMFFALCIFYIVGFGVSKSPIFSSP